MVSVGVNAAVLHVIAVIASDLRASMSGSMGTAISGVGSAALVTFGTVVAGVSIAEVVGKASDVWGGPVRLVVKGSKVSEVMPLSVTVRCLVVAV